MTDFYDQRKLLEEQKRKRRAEVFAQIFRDAEEHATIRDATLKARTYKETE